MKYYIRVVDEDENVLLSVGTHNINLSRRSDQKIICQQIQEVCQQDNENQIEMELSDG
jgi:hypothetical protein|tara:strand:- start:592 stop:765 length:174 start_codon:yes stop_codon:yes gene_type:complete